MEELIRHSAFFFLEPDENADDVDTSTLSVSMLTKTHSKSKFWLIFPNLF